MKVPEVLDLFAGCGGFSLGFHLAGYHIKALIENDYACYQTLTLNFPESEIMYQDITRIDLNELEKKFKNIDILLAGPPCQGFSVAGTSWVDHDRIQTLNNLYLIPIAIVEVIRPKVVVIENVPAVLSKSNILFVVMAISRLQNLGYKVFPILPENLNTILIEDFYTLSKIISTSLLEYGTNSRIKLLSNPDLFFEFVSKIREKVNNFPSSNIFTYFYLHCWNKIKNHSERSSLSKIRLNTPNRMKKYISDKKGIFDKYTTDQLAKETETILNFLNDKGFLLDDARLGRENMIKSLKALKTIDRYPELPPSFKNLQYENIMKLYKEILNLGDEWGKQIRKNAIINSEDHGTPQERRRVFIFAFNSSPISNFPITPTKRKVVLGEVLSDLPVLVPGEGTDQQVPYPFSANLSDFQLYIRKNSKGIFNHRARSINDPFYLLRYAMLYQGANDLTFPFYLQKFIKKNFVDTWSRLISNRPSKVIFAHLAKDGNSHVHPHEERSITIREAARIQGFPDNFIFPPSEGFTEHFRQIGNAVSVQVAKSIAKFIGEQLGFCLVKKEFKGFPKNFLNKNKDKKDCGCFQTRPYLRGTTQCICGQYTPMKLNKKLCNEFLAIINEFHLGTAHYEEETGYILWDEIESKNKFKINTQILENVLTITIEANRPHSLKIYKISIQRADRNHPEKAGFLGGWNYNDKLVYWFVMICPNLPWSIQRDIVSHSDFPYSINNYLMMNESPDVFCKYIAFLLGIEDPVFNYDSRQKKRQTHLEDFFLDVYPIPQAINREWVWEKLKTTIKVFETIWKQNNVSIGVLIKIEVYQSNNEFTLVEAIVSKLKYIEELDNILNNNNFKRITEYDRLQSNIINFYSHLILYEHNLVTEKELKLYWGEKCFKNRSL